MRLVLLVALAGCFTSGPPAPVAVVSPKAVAAPAKQPETAEEIVAAMQAAYATAASYVDSGEVVTEFTGRHAFTRTKSFTTAFVRAPFQFRFEYLEERNPAKSYVIWAADDRVFSKWYIRPAAEDLGDDLQVAIAAATGVSSVSSYRVPSWLLPDRLETSPPRELRLEGKGTHDGRAIWRLVIDGELTFIDRRSFAILRVERTHALDNGVSSRSITTYHPTFGDAVDPAKLAKPDTTNATIVPRPVWIGVQFSQATVGAVEGVVPSSPAAAAGIVAGDRVATIDGKTFPDSATLVAYIRAQPVGAKLVVDLAGRGAVAVVVAARPSPQKLVRDLLMNKPAPAFPELAKHRGKVVVVDFWATWCGPCRATMPKLAALHARYAPRGLHILGITDEDKPTVDAFLAANPVPYAIALDANKQIASAYALQAIPMLVIIDKAGVVRHVSLGGEISAVEALVAKLLM